jgi:hypothetical protein
MNAHELGVAEWWDDCLGRQFLKAVIENSPLGHTLTYTLDFQRERRSSMTMINAPFAFREWVRAEGAPYSIIAAQASMDVLVEGLQNLFPILQSHQPNVTLEGKLTDLQGIPIIKFKDTPWCVIYWSVGRSLLLQNDCQMLSNRMNTKVLNLMERDRSGWTEWSLYENSETLESAQWMTYDDSVYFESSLKNRTKLPEGTGSDIRSIIDQSVDELLIQQGIEVPELNLDLADSRIERVDLLVMPEFPLGMKDFQNWIYQGHPEYAIFAVKAPIDQVAKTLVDQGFATEWQQRLQATCIGEVFQDGFSMPLVQLTANPWTVVYWLVGEWDDLSDVCQRCSSTLQTQAISLAEEDTSGAIGYEIYDQGQKIEQLEGCPGEELMFESETRDEPELDDFENSEMDAINHFINQIFCQEGVYIPDLSLSLTDSWIVRVDSAVRSSGRYASR